MFYQTIDKRFLSLIVRALTHLNCVSLCIMFQQKFYQHTFRTLRSLDGQQVSHHIYFNILNFSYKVLVSKETFIIFKFNLKFGYFPHVLIQNFVDEINIVLNGQDHQVI